jgi:hypothetical protein
MVRLLTLVAAGLTLVSGIAAADLSGIWMGQIPGRRGVSDISFQLAQDEAKLGGKLYEEYGSSPIVEGNIDGENFVFVVVAREQAGNQVNLVSYRYMGRVLDGELELTRERVGAVDAVSGANFVLRKRSDDVDEAPPKILLKRLL